MSEYGSVGVCGETQVYVAVEVEEMTATHQTFRFKVPPPRIVVSKGRAGLIKPKAGND